MSIHGLRLHIAQAGKSLYKARNNNYSDRRKQEYQECLEELYKKVVSSVSSKEEKDITNVFCFEQKRVLDFIYKSLEFLDSSTLNLIPYEIVECLSIALKDWIPDGDQYIIVTSLINEIFGFSFDTSLVDVDKQYDDFKQNYNIDFKSRLIQINIPKALSKDYLASVVHYHELGHFIDTKYFVTDSLARTLN